MFQTLNMVVSNNTFICCLLYLEVIINHVCNGSDVYRSLLDASKAFDTIHYDYGIMFNTLILN